MPIPLLPVSPGPLTDTGPPGNVFVFLPAGPPGPPGPAATFADLLQQSGKTAAPQKPVFERETLPKLEKVTLPKKAQTAKTQIAMDTSPASSPTQEERVPRKPDGELPPTEARTPVSVSLPLLPLFIPTFAAPALPVPSLPVSAEPLLPAVVKTPGTVTLPVAELPPVVEAPALKSQVLAEPAVPPANPSVSSALAVDAPPVTAVPPAIASVPIVLASPVPASLENVLQNSVPEKAVGRVPVPPQASSVPSREPFRVLSLKDVLPEHKADVLPEHKADVPPERNVSGAAAIRIALPEHLKAAQVRTGTDIKIGPEIRIGSEPRAGASPIPLGIALKTGNEPADTRTSTIAGQAPPQADFSFLMAGTVPAAPMTPAAMPKITVAGRAEIVKQAAEGVKAIGLPTRPETPEQITIHLHPKDWGKLHVTVTLAPQTLAEAAGERKMVTAHVIAESPQVKAALESSTGELHHALRAAGMHLEKLTVSVQPATAQSAARPDPSPVPTGGTGSQSGMTFGSFTGHSQSGKQGAASGPFPAFIPGSEPEERPVPMAIRQFTRGQVDTLA